MEYTYVYRVLYEQTWLFGKLYDWTYDYIGIYHLVQTTFKIRLKDAIRYELTFSLVINADLIFMFFRWCQSVLVSISWSVFKSAEHQLAQSIWRACDPITSLTATWQLVNAIWPRDWETNPSPNFYINSPLFISCTECCQSDKNGVGKKEEKRCFVCWRNIAEIVTVLLKLNTLLLLSEHVRTI